MFRRSLRKVVQGRLQGAAGLSRGRTVYHLPNRPQRSEEHLNAPVAVGEQTGGVGKIVGLGSNLDGHDLSLLIAVIRTMTKVTLRRIAKPEPDALKVQSF
jgi:hypothetical protein